MVVRVGANASETTFGSLDQHTIVLVIDPLRERTEDQTNSRFVAQWTTGGGPDFGALLWSGDFCPPSLSARQIFLAIFIRCVAHKCNWWDQLKLSPHACLDLQAWSHLE